MVEKSVGIPLPDRNCLSVAWMDDNRYLAYAWGEDSRKAEFYLRNALTGKERIKGSGVFSIDREGKKGSGVFNLDKDAEQ